jgi:hypothetical protein
MSPAHFGTRTRFSPTRVLKSVESHENHQTAKNRASYEPRKFYTCTFCAIFITSASFRNESSRNYTFLYCLVLSSIESATSSLLNLARL